MTGRIEKTVFISYRRTNFWTALAVFQNLHSNGYDVFFDYKSIPSGDFAQVIEENIRSRTHFIVILSPSALERCNEPGDWLRREIEMAIENKRNIIPLMMEGFDFGSPAAVNALTSKLADLKRYNAIGIPAEYFDDAMIKLRSEKFLNRPLESISHPVSEVTARITEVQKSAATEAAPVEKELLTAQEWFERGVKLNDYSVEEIRFYSEAIRLDPSFAEAYFFRGLTHGENGDLDKAITDFDKAILIQPNDADFYDTRGYARDLKGDLDGAISDYSETIRLEPKNANAYYSRANIWEKKRNYSAATADYQKYLELGSKIEDGNRKEVEEMIKKLKSKLTKKKPSRKNSK